MKRWIGILLFAASSGLHAAQPPVSVAEIREFVPAGRKVIARLDADVNRDGVPDVVFVAASDSEHTVTVLMRLHGKTVDGKGQMKGLQGIDSLQIEVTPHGPPTVSVRKDVLIIESMTGGSSVRTTAIYRYRFEPDEGRMRLIGLDAERTSSTAGIKMSWNTLNGTRIVQRSKVDSQGFRFGPESKSIEKAGGPIYMSLTPNPEDILDKLVTQGQNR
jgi:hypothetical protein